MGYCGRPNHVLCRSVKVPWNLGKEKPLSAENSVRCCIGAWMIRILRTVQRTEDRLVNFSFSEGSLKTLSGLFPIMIQNSVVFC